jgi:hypothetical protein
MTDAISIVLPAASAMRNFHGDTLARPAKTLPTGPSIPMKRVKILSDLRVS